MNILGYQIGKVNKKATELETFAIDREHTADSAVSETHASSVGGILSLPFDLTSDTAHTDLIISYRELAASPEVDTALQEIRNEVFIYDVPGKRAVSLDFIDKSGLSAAIRKKIVQEFDNVYDLMEFDSKGTQWFDDWFVDSKLFVYKMVDMNNMKAGIQRLQSIDPLKIRKVRIIPQPNMDGTYDVNKVREIFLYRNFDLKTTPLNQVINLQFGQNLNGVQIRPESITYVNSGRFDRNMGTYIGYLKKAIAPFNMLKMMEDAMVIFRVVRAPQRRAFYIDVAGMQKNKADAYMKNMMAKFKNNMVYDTKTGSLADRRNIMSMMEDYWLPRREQRTTEIQNIEGQNSQDILDEIEYLRNNLWQALNVPRSRFSDQQGMNLFGRGNEITRDEYRFTKYLHTLRSQFTLVFEDILRTQLILKKIISEQEWEDIRKTFKWVYTEDNTFVEAKENELLTSRITALSTVDPFVGKYFSYEWVCKNVLKMTDKEIEIEKARIKSEKADGMHVDPNVDPSMTPGSFGSPDAPPADDTSPENNFGTSTGEEGDLNDEPEFTNPFLKN